MKLKKKLIISALILTISLRVGTTITANKGDKDTPNDSTYTEQIIESADSTLNKIENMSNRLDSIMLVMEKLNE